ncbi:MAG TPA: hypothetical protein VKY22_04335 [Bradyrhizobium sp.]|nr:hypothetical protein [Bradyrhizobium sp.]
MSISSVSSNTYQSPLQKLEAELQTEVSNGTISSSDQSALSSALKDIDSAIKSGQSSDSSGKLSPSDMQSKIDDLIQNEVSSGKLTSAQATELKGVFQSTFAQGAGGTGSASLTVDASSITSSSTSSSTATSSTDTSSISELLQQFLQALQSSLSSSSSTSYNASGTSTTSDNGSQLQAILIDYKT